MSTERHAHGDRPASPPSARGETGSSPGCRAGRVSGSRNSSEHLNDGSPGLPVREGAGYRSSPGGSAEGLAHPALISKAATRLKPTAKSRPRACRRSRRRRCAPGAFWFAATEFPLRSTSITKPSLAPPRAEQSIAPGQVDQDPVEDPLSSPRRSARGSAGPSRQSKTSSRGGAFEEVDVAGSSRSRRRPGPSRRARRPGPGSRRSNAWRWTASHVYMIGGLQGGERLPGGEVPRRTTWPSLSPVAT